MYAFTRLLDCVSGWQPQHRWIFAISPASISSHCPNGGEIPSHRKDMAGYQAAAATSLCAYLCIWEKISRAMSLMNFESIRYISGQFQRLLPMPLYTLYTGAVGAITLPLLDISVSIQLQYLFQVTLVASCSLDRPKAPEHRMGEIEESIRRN